MKAFHAYYNRTFLDMERIYTKEDLLEAVRVGNPDRIREIMSGMSGEELEAAEELIWKEPVFASDVKDAERAFGVFKKRIRGSVSPWKTIRIIGISSIAASLLLVAGFRAGTWSMDREMDALRQTRWVECSVRQGGMEHIMLADGTKLWANAGTSVFYPDDFTGDEREIFISGEVYLEVAKNPDRPFIVNAGGTRIRVTGTKFNVKAYAEDGTVTTTLMEGGVVVSVPGHEEIALSPGNVLYFDKKDGIVDTYPVRMGMFPSWFKGEFNAYHVSFAQIARDLERRFGVKIVIRNAKVGEEMFYASFVNDEDVDKILSKLNVDGIFKIKRNGDVIDIY